MPFLSDSGGLHPSSSLLNEEQKKHGDHHYKYVNHADNWALSSEKDVKVNSVQSDIDYESYGN